MIFDYSPAGLQILPDLGFAAARTVLGLQP
jgi:hypothetical protein